MGFASLGSDDFKVFQIVVKKSRLQNTYLDIPETVPSPWFRVDPHVVSFVFVVAINLLCIPFKIADDFWIIKMIHNPPKQRSAPSVILFVNFTIFSDDFVMIKLGVGTG